MEPLINSIKGIMAKLIASCSRPLPASMQARRKGAKKRTTAWMQELELCLEQSPVYTE